MAKYLHDIYVSIPAEYWTRVDMELIRRFHYINDHVTMLIGRRVRTKGIWRAIVYLHPHSATISNTIVADREAPQAHCRIDFSVLERQLDDSAFGKMLLRAVLRGLRRLAKAYEFSYDPFDQARRKMEQQRYRFIHDVGEVKVNPDRTVVCRQQFHQDQRWATVRLILSDRKTNEILRQSIVAKRLSFQGAYWRMGGTVTWINSTTVQYRSKEIGRKRVNLARH